MKTKPWDARNRHVHRGAYRWAPSTSYLTLPKGRFTSSTTKQRLRRLRAWRFVSSVHSKTTSSRSQASMLVRQPQPRAGKLDIFTLEIVPYQPVSRVWLRHYLAKVTYLRLVKERGG